MKNKKNLMLLLFMALLFSVFLWPNKAKAGNDYATTWQMSEGKSFQVISGNLGTNTNGTPYTVKSGEKTNFFVMYSTMTSDPTNPPNIEAGKMALRIKLPSTFKGTLERVANDNWILKEGSETSPDGSAESGVQYRYFWMVSAVDMPVASTETLTFMITPFKNGVTPDEESLEFSTSLYNLNNASKVSNEQTSSFVANTDLFNWNSANVSIEGQNQSFTHYTDEAISDKDITGDLKFESKVTPNPNNPNYESETAVFGTGYAKSVTFSNSFALPLDSEDDSCPLIKIDETMFYDTQGNPLDSSAITLEKNASGKVIGFTVKSTVNNPDLTKQFSAPTYKFIIKGAKINSSCASLANLTNGNSKTFSINLVDSKYEIEPAVKLDDSVNLSLNGTLDKKASGMTPMNFTYKVLDRETPEDSHKDTKKQIISIAGRPTAQMEPPYSAYPGDNVVYEIGAEHIQNKNSNPLTLIYTEEEGVSYNKNQITPTNIYTGNINGVHGKWKVVVEYSDGTANLVRENQNNGVNIAVPNSKNVKKITISNDLPSGYTINRGHYITYSVVNQEDISKEGTIFKNTVEQYFKYDNFEKTTNDTVNFTYKLRPFNQGGYFESNKSASNLNSQTGRENPKIGDVLQFTIFLSNEEGGTKYVDKILDYYTDTYLTLYNGNTKTVDGSETINAKYLNASNAMNLVLWESDPTQGTSIPVSFPGGEPLIVDNNGIISIDFKDKLAITEGKTYYLTYTMSVKEGYDFNKHIIGNEFNSYYDGFKNGEGKFYWGVETGTGVKSSEKWHKNASVPTTVTNPWDSAPYGDDIVLYTARIKNNSGIDWNGNVVFKDTFTEELERYDGSTGLNLNCDGCDKLALGSAYNLAALETGSTIKVKTSNGIENIGTTAANFDISQVSVIDADSNDNTFEVNLGNNTIKSGESVVLVYTLKVKSNVDVTDNNEFNTKENEIINECVISYLNSPKGNCRDVWYVNSNQNTVGYIDLLKGVIDVSNSHATNRIEHNDEITYRVTMANDHIKANRAIEIGSLLDTLPSNLSYVNDSFKLKYFVTEYETNGSVTNNPNDYIKGDGVKTEVTPPVGANNYTLTYIDSNNDGVNDSLKVVWDTPIKLTTASYEDDAFKKVRVYSYEYEYKVKASTSDIPENQSSRVQTNNIKVFMTNKTSELVKKNGTIYDDTTNNKDEIDNTLSYVEQQNSVTLINDNYNYGKVTKEVTSGNANFNVDSASEGRAYKITINNTGAKDYTVSSFVDILPLYEAIKQDSIKINNVDINQDKLFVDEYSINNSGMKNQRFIYNEDIIIPKSTNVVITYSTMVDKDELHTVMKTNDKGSITGLQNSFAFYMKDNANLTLNGGGNSANDDGQDGNWDDNPNTIKRHVASMNVSYIDNVIVPGVDILPYIVLDSGATQSYIQNVTPINPGDTVAWKVQFGNATNATTAIKAGSKIIVVLPEGVNFDANNDANQYLASTAANTTNTNTIAVNKTKPTWLNDPTVSINASNQQVIEWTVNANYNKGTYAAFMIKTATQVYKYTSYAPEVYFVPIQDDTQNIYTDSMVSTSNNLNTAWKGYQYLVSDISILDPTQSKESNYVKDSVFIDVYGAYGLSALKEVSDGTNKITSRDSNRVLELDSRSDILTYTLKIEAVKNDTHLTNIVFIDRLPTVGDVAVIGDAARDSEAAVRLQGNGNIRVLYKENNNSNEVTMTPLQYRTEYFFGAANEKFSNDDKNGVIQPSRWFSESEAIAQNKDLNKATGLRVVITDSNVIIGGNGEIRVLFDAHLGEKVEDYNVSNKIANNNFGYKLEYGVAQNYLASEVVSVGVKAPVKDSIVTINKSVDLNNHTSIDEKKYFESISKNKIFDFILEGKDNTGTVKYQEEFTINTDSVTSGGYKGVLEIENLDPSLKYNLKEKENKNFISEIKVSTEIVDDQMRYTFDVENVWNPVKVELKKKWLDTNSNEFAQSTINNALGAYIKGNIKVNLYNSANTKVDVAKGSVEAIDDLSTPTIDESTLNTSQLVVASSDISLTNLNADFGYLNAYDAKNNKIIYEVAEDTTALNHSFFEVSSSYKENTSDSKVTGVFTLNNKIIGGSVTLTKKDDLNNTLSGVEFTLSDPIGIKTKYITDSTGKITLTNINPGNYSFEETKGLEGYLGLNNPIDFTVEPNSKTTLNLNAINNIIRGSVELSKFDELSNRLGNAQFELYDENDSNVGTTYITDANGYIKVDNLIPGNYYFKEIKAPDGYIKSDSKIKFEIEHNPNAVVKVNAINEIIKGEVELTKFNEVNQVLAGAQFELYDINNNRLGDTYVSDTNGKILVDKLLPGKYYFKEIKAPDGYLMMPNDVDRLYYFEINFNPTETTKISAYNYKPLEIDPPVSKKVIGNDPNNTRFKFEMMGLGNAPMPQGSMGNKKIISAGEGKVEFGVITIDKVGQYKYNIKEISGKNKRYEYDNKVYTINVDVTFNGRELQKKISYDIDGKSKKINKVEFVNKYTAAKKKIVRTGSNELFLGVIAVISSMSLIILRRKSIEM